MIHTITAYGPGPDHFDRDQPNGSRHVFGYYLMRESAIDAVARNAMDMHECLFTHLVIEAVSAGIHGRASDEAWFYWDQEAWHPCGRPAWAEGVVNHSMG